MGIFSDHWKAHPYEAPRFDKAKLSRDELTKAREIIREWQEKNRPAYDIIEYIQRGLKIDKYRAERVYWTETKKNDTVATRSLGKEIGFTKYKVILSPSACPLCVKKSDNGRKIFTDAEVHKSGYGQFVPWHPNAVLEGTTFQTYGALYEMVGADYEGPAILLETSEGKNLTIGPNHPVLTQRGMIKASDLTILDYLVYDERCNESSVVLDSDLKNVPLVEDSFVTILATGNKSTVPVSTNDLHGDGIFCKGEVDIVKPADGLLFKLDSGGIEKFRESGFVGADMESVFLSSNSTSNLSLDTVHLASSSGMSSTLLSYRFLHIHSIHYVDFKGKAFDARTETTVYNSNGFVVSNCYCITVPVE